MRVEIIKAANNHNALLIFNGESTEAYSSDYSVATAKQDAKKVVDLLLTTVPKQTMWEIVGIIEEYRKNLK